MREFMGLNKLLDEDFNALGIKLSESKYEISSKKSGTVLGVYKGKNKLDAYQSMLKDAGYSKRKLAPGQKKWNKIPSDIEVEELDESRRISEAIDKHAVRELDLYISNDSKFYNEKVNVFWKNLVIKIAQGKYDSKKAADLFMHFVEKGARAYIKEFGGGKWNEVFPKPERIEVAKGFRDEFESVIETGEYDSEFKKFVPKKYSGINLKKSMKKGKAVMNEGRGFVFNEANGGGLSRQMKKKVLRWASYSDINDFDPEDEIASFFNSDSATIEKDGSVFIGSDSGMGGMDGRWANDREMKRFFNYIGEGRLVRGSRNTIREAISVSTGERVLVESKSKGKLTEGEGEELVDFINNDEGLYFRLEDLKKDVFEDILNGFVGNKRDLEEYFIDFVEQYGVAVGNNVSRRDIQQAGRDLAYDFYYEVKNKRSRDRYISNSFDYYNDEVESEENISDFLRSIKY